MEKNTRKTPEKDLLSDLETPTKKEASREPVAPKHGNPDRIMRIGEITGNSVPARIKTQEEDIKARREKDWRMVEGRFEFFEQPGGELTFNFFRYEEDPVLDITLKDGMVYKIPMMVARHLVTQGARPEYKAVMGEDGLPRMVVSRLTHRYGFQNLEFVDIEDLKLNFRLEDQFEKPVNQYAIPVASY